MELGNFSVSLAVKDIAASLRFYEQLGFTVFMGEPAQNWLILKTAMPSSAYSRACSRATSSLSTRAG